MENIFSELLVFVETNSTPDFLVDFERKIGKRNLRLIVIKLLSWLKLLGKTKKNNSITLEPTLEWHKHLISFISETNELVEYFSVSDNKVYFGDKIQPDDYQNIVKFVSDNYNPRLFVDLDSKYRK